MLQGLQGQTLRTAMETPAHHDAPSPQVFARGATKKSNGAVRGVYQGLRNLSACGR